MNTRTLKDIGVAISLLVGIGAASRALALLIAIASFATPATAATVDPDPSVELHDQAAAEAIDIAIIADDKGWSLAATRRHLDDQHAFGELQDQIEAQFPTKFAGAEFAASPSGRSYLRFKGAVPSAARSLATDAGLNVGLTGGRKYSAAELANRSVAVVRFFGDAGYQLVGSAVLAKRSDRGRGHRRTDARSRTAAVAERRRAGHVRRPRRRRGVPHVRRRVYARQLLRVHQRLHRAVPAHQRDGCDHRGPLQRNRPLPPAPRWTELRHSFRGRARGSERRRAMAHDSATEYSTPTSPSTTPARATSGRSTRWRPPQL